MKRWLIAALVASQPLCLSQLRAEPVTQSVEAHDNAIGDIDRRADGFVHRSAGYHYPAMLGEMPARKTTTYGPRDAEVYYTLRGGANGDPWLDLFVYPAQLNLAEEAAELSALLKKNYQGTERVSPLGLPSLPPGAREQWFDVILKGVPAITGYRLVRDGDWFIKVRMSIPKSGGQVALDRAWKGLAAVPWSVAARPVVNGAPDIRISPF